MNCKNKLPEDCKNNKTMKYKENHNYNISNNSVCLGKRLKELDIKKLK